MNYEIRFTDGSPTETYPGYHAAITAACVQYGSDVVVGHPGDLTHGGEGTYVWADRESAARLDSARAVAVIHPVA